MDRELPIPGSRMEKRTPADHLLYVRQRLVCCIEMIDGTLEASEPEVRAGCWIIGEEILNLLPRLWIGVRKA